MTAMNFKQLFCLHWFNEVQTNEFSEYYGAIVCTQQKSRIYTQESRTCSKCGLVDTRRIGEAIFEGWS